MNFVQSILNSRTPLSFTALLFAWVVRIAFAAKPMSISVATLWFCLSNTSKFAILYTVSAESKIDFFHKSVHKLTTHALQIFCKKHNHWFISLVLVWFTFCMTCQCYFPHVAQINCFTTQFTIGHGRTFMFHNPVLKYRHCKPLLLKFAWITHGDYSDWWLVTIYKETLSQLCLQKHQTSKLLQSHTNYAYLQSKSK